MNRKLIFLVLILVWSADPCLLAQEPHMREAKSVDELLKEKRPDEYRALQNHDKYLVVNKFGSAKVRKYFAGEEFGFMNQDLVRFTGNLANVTDSTFTLYYFDDTEQRYLHRLFYLSEVAIVFKRNLKPGLDYRFSPVIFLPFALDWIYFKRPPWQNTGSLALLAGIEVARVAVVNRHKFSNRMKIDDKYRLVVFQY